MSKKRFIRLFAVILALSLLAAACGGDGGGDTSTNEPVPAGEIPVGGTLRIAGASDVDYMDPASMYYTLSWDLARGVFRTLVTYPAVADFEEQNVLVPDLATDVGTPNADSSEWTFTLKDWIKFGPALGGEAVPGVTGEPITSADIKYALERVFIPSVGGGYPFYYDIMEGTQDFVDGKADEITGIETPDDKTIIFHLTEPAGDWPFRMAMPASAPVPADYAAGFDAEKDSDYDSHVVASGPYYVAEWTPEEQITLERNEEWDPDTDDVREAYVDTVDWKLGFDNDVGVQKVQDGDYEIGLDVSPQGPALEQTLNDPELSKRLINEPSLCDRYIFLNTTVEPFDSLEVRQAVNWAIDRANLKTLEGGPITGDIATSIIPPGMGGYLSTDEYNPFGTDGMAGDMDKAKELMAAGGYPDGYDGELLFVGASDPPHDKYAESVRADLEALGFSNLNVKTPAFPNQYTQFYGIPDKNVAIGTSAGWCKDYNDAFTFLDPLFSGDNILPSGNQNYAELDDPAVNDAISTASKTPFGPERDTAWEEANRLATESGAWVPWTWDNETIIYSENLVNPIYNTFFSHIDWVVVGVTTAE
ncbi:MAG: ABC transporter substrate-binding protein [Actinobacteria bacterium]|nr:ABC transporter substrate-binding protein [Actinomycetota bacterium]